MSTQTHSADELFEAAVAAIGRATSLDTPECVDALRCLALHIEDLTSMFLSPHRGARHPVLACERRGSSGRVEARRGTPVHALGRARRPGRGPHRAYLRRVAEPRHADAPTSRGRARRVRAYPRHRGAVVRQDTAGSPATTRACVPRAGSWREPMRRFGRAGRPSATVAIPRTRMSPRRPADTRLGCRARRAVTATAGSASPSSGSRSSQRNATPPWPSSPLQQPHSTQYSTQSPFPRSKSKSVCARQARRPRRRYQSVETRRGARCDAEHGPPR